MSRKTYSFSAAALTAALGLSFTSADGAGAAPQDEVAAQAELVAGQENSALVEIVPQPTQFISQEVVQPLANDQADETADVVTPAPVSLRDLVSQIDAKDTLSEQMQCLAGAVYFESRGEPLAGQLAVAQVVINRAEDSRWPASYCGVVYQRAQFSFVKDGRMPSIKTSSGAWDRAKSIARIAHDGLWTSEAGDAVYFHADYVSPKWSRRKQRTAQIDTHIFYR